jgi:hypothetical protein
MAEMTNDELLRTALLLSAKAWSRLEADSKTMNEVEVLRRYIRLCPYVSPDGAAVKAALQGLDLTHSYKKPTPSLPLPSTTLIDQQGKKSPINDASEHTHPSVPRFTGTLIDQDEQTTLPNGNASEPCAPLVDEKSEKQLRRTDSPTNTIEDNGQKHSRNVIPRPGPPPLGDNRENSPRSVAMRPDGPRNNEGEDQLHSCVTVDTSTPLKSEERKVPRNAAPLNPRRSWFGVLVRTLVLDAPLLIALLIYAAVDWVHYVEVHYLTPQLSALEFSPSRYDSERTYYERTCSVEDMTTTNGADLFLPLDATPEEAYQHQLLHGFTVFPSVLSEETANNLRDFILSRNRKLTEDENILVIAGEKRFSFGLGTEEQSEQRALMELASSDQLKPALEEVLGPNPALIELTAITASYGAKAQYWHADVIPTVSALNFARTFGSTYSVFIPLQNMTREIGATLVCPGTHYCSHYCSQGDIEGYCEAKGVQLERENESWQMGEALLMNMNSYHRGGAHVDPNGPDRVMMILTFVSQPMRRAESRQMSGGITFSLRWDMWGHTLHDLANADYYMTHPWTTLRALGLYKPAVTDWGVDYITGASMRIANSGHGFGRDDLDDFIEMGGFAWLPKFLHGEVTEQEGWLEYCQNTLLLCKEFVTSISVYALQAYICFFLIASLLPIKRGKRLYTIRCALGRLLAIVAISFLCSIGAKLHVDKTGWAADIKTNMRYASTTDSEIVYAGLNDELDGPTTVPTRFDVLIETRYGSRQLAMYNDFISGHPGNRFFNKFVRNSAWTYREYPFEFQQASADYVCGAVALEQGRFLKQSPAGAWVWVSHGEAISYGKRALTLASSDLLSHLAKSIRFMLSNLKYGISRHTAMDLRHTTPFLTFLQDKLLKNKLPPRKLTVLGATRSNAIRAKTVFRLFKLPRLRTREITSPVGARSYRSVVSPRNPSREVG